MTQIEQIKAEIERLKEHNRQFIFASAAQVSMEAGVKQEAYNEVLAFIDSLSTDSKLGQINFEQAVYDAFGQVKDFTLAMRIARYFYEKAEKDLALTWEDMDKIMQIEDYLNRYAKIPLEGRITFCGEVLRRFNESKQSKVI